MLSACGGKNIEKLCDGSSLSWDGFGAHHVEGYKYYALFEDGTLTIEERTPKNYPNTSGPVWTADKTLKFQYTLKGNDTVIIEGETYTYTISDRRVTFDKKLMGIEDSWIQKH